MKNKSTAIVLAFFLGWLGIHRFYVGNTVLGILYLVFSITLIPAFVAFIDAIVWLTWSDEKWNLKFNHNSSITVPPAAVPPVLVANTIAYELPYYVHGLKHHDYSSVKHFIRQGMDVQLVAEPDNTYDENAVKVMLGDKQLGYIAADDAQSISSDLVIYDAYKAQVRYHDPQERQIDQRIALSIKFWDN